MRLSFSILFTFIFLLSCSKQDTNDDQISDQKLIDQISKQENFGLSLAKNLDAKKMRVFPRSTNKGGEVSRVGKKDWTSGFYPGVLWLMYGLSKDNEWKQEASKYTELLEKEQYNDSNHDIGFKMMSSYGQGYRLTGNKEYRDILIQSARTLISRFNEKVGCIRSWDHHKDIWDYPVIIDNMINLELLFFASRETGDLVYSNIAIKHAQTTLKNHFRPDFSTYHVVSYDTISGEVAAKQTRQGFAHESSWARGQAWALYGYSMAYRETEIPDFLDQAEKVANYIFNVAQLPDDYIPYWDFSVPDIAKEPRDVSSAAIMASALYEMSTFSATNKKLYLSIANKIIDSLSSKKYLNEIGTNGGFLLRHSTGSKPSNSEIDVPLIYADYYFLEAISRRNDVYKHKQ